MTRRPDPTRGFLDALLELRLEMSLLNYRIADEVGLNAGDLDCLEVLSRHGATSPAKLAARLGIHRATMTGILARLEDTGWIARAADPEDGRAAVIRISPMRDARLKARYAAATRAVVKAVSARSDADVAVVVELLRDITSRARSAR